MVHDKKFLHYNHDNGFFPSGISVVESSMVSFGPSSLALGTAFSIWLNWIRIFTVVELEHVVGWAVSATSWAFLASSLAIVASMILIISNNFSCMTESKVSFFATLHAVVTWRCMDCCDAKLFPQCGHEFGVRMIRTIATQGFLRFMCRFRLNVVANFCSHRSQTCWGGAVSMVLMVGCLLVCATNCMNMPLLYNKNWRLLGAFQNLTHACSRCRPHCCSLQLLGNIILGFLFRFLLAP
jgi:hypothetical protein